MNFSGGIEWAPFMFEAKSIQAKIEDVKIESTGAKIASTTARIDNIVTGLNNSSVCDIRSGMLTVFT